MKDRRRDRARWVVTGVLLLGLAASLSAAFQNAPPVPPDTAARLKRYDSRYYVFYTDLPAERIRNEIVPHMTSVAETFWESTKSYGGKIRGKMQFYVIADQKDYAAAGGQAYGCAWGDRLLAWATPTQAKEFWHVVQHEAFHMFAHTVVSDKLPGWVDEGLAEYFGESLWTGDDVCTGIVPATRYQRLQQMIRDDKVIDFQKIITIEASNWTGIDHYDQAWAMIHFLIHAEDGKHRKKLDQFINLVKRGAPWDQAFARVFGRNIRKLQDEYVAWWKAQPESVVDRSYARATVATLASYLARAHLQKQQFDDFEAFRAAAADGSLKIGDTQPLPDTLLKDALERAAKLNTWSLENPKTGPPKLTLKQDDFPALTAVATLNGGKVDRVKVTQK
ncbi:MAG TPA: DUF1570 domain-containing protein [Planctomycetota bacterium]|nr:DUF1570 domain-containing protein [Planctomycetota bacterium]